MNQKHYEFLLKKQRFSEIKASYEKNGEVSWATFNADQNQNKNKVVLLENSDFAAGTLRIHYPCMLKLTENVSFNPNRPTTWLNDQNNITNDFTEAVAIDPNRALDWFPSQSVQGNDQYFEPEVRFAYGLGFFAAIAIEAADVLVNLNNFRLEQHKEHALQQRFFANIELADQPFIPLQGPSNFGAILRSAKNIWIFGGTIGLSSHHGIHGNQANNILITDVDFEDFEVAAISLNGSKDLSLENVNVKNNRHDIPVLGTYSAARFIKSFVTYLQTNNLSSTGLDTAFTALKLDLDAAFNSIIFDNGAVSDLFKNTSGLIDGNGYGIVINPKGVAVGTFLQSRSSNKANETTNIYISNVSVNSIHGKINEVVAIDNGNGKAQVDTAGAVLQFFVDVSNLTNDKYYYNGTTLSNVQIELAKIKTDLEANNQPTNFFGTLNITKGIQTWKDDSDTYFEKTDDTLKLMKNNAPFLIDSNEVVYKILCNGDSMFHVNKGMIGFRVDGANCISVKNCNISDIKNDGELGSELSGYYVLSHPDQGNLIGYQGALVYGMTVSGCNEVEIEHLNLSEISSKHATACALLVQNDTQNCCINKINVNGVYSAIDDPFDYNMKLPNKYPISRCICIGSNQFNVKVNDINHNNIKNNEDCSYDMTFDIHSI